MTITVQSRAPGGDWETRNRFHGRGPAVIAQAHRIADTWRINYPENREIRVHDSNAKPTVSRFNVSEADHV